MHLIFRAMGIMQTHLQVFFFFPTGTAYLFSHVSMG